LRKCAKPSFQNYLNKKVECQYPSSGEGELIAEDVLKRLKEAVMNYDVEGTVDASKEVIKTGFDPLKAIEQGLGEGLKIVGEKFEAAELFLPMLMIAAQAMKESQAILEPTLAKGASRKVAGKVVIGTVEGDIHDIGKSIVAAMLTANGFEVTLQPQSSLKK